METKETREINLTQCGTCQQLKQRILIGKYGKDKRYVDENGLSWNGKKYCGLCNLNRVRSHMKGLRDNRKQEAFNHVLGTHKASN